MNMIQFAAAGVAVFIVARALQLKQAKATVQAAVTPDPGNWYEDQWARMNGLDLALGNQPTLPTSFDAYGVTGFGWDGSRLPAAA